MFSFLHLIRDWHCFDCVLFIHIVLFLINQSLCVEVLFMRCFYRPKTKFTKVMFSQVSVCLQGGCGVKTPPLAYGQQADGTHLTGMHSCWVFFAFTSFFFFLCLGNKKIGEISSSSFSHFATIIQLTHLALEKNHSPVSTLWNFYWYIPQRSCWKVMFLHLSLIVFTEGACVARGCAWWRGYVWWRGGMCGRRDTPQADTPRADTPPFR